MPAYAFEALDAEGQTRKGVIEADTAKAARGLLRAQALVPLEVTPVGAGGPGRGASGSRWAPAASSTPRGSPSGRASSPAWSPPACRWSAR